jgi:hypothetical protein
MCELCSDLGLMEHAFPEVPIVCADRIVFRRQKLQRLLRVLFAVLLFGIDIGEKVKSVARVDVVGFLHVCEL